MWLERLLHFVVCFLVQASLVNARCGSPSPKQVTIKETDTSKRGLVFYIWAINATISFNVMPSTRISADDFNQYFKLEKPVKNVWHLVLRKPVDLDQDLDVARNENGGVHLTVLMTCTDHSTHYKSKSFLELTVEAVDEFKPFFIGTLFHLREDVRTGPFADMRTLVLDLDYFDRNASMKFLSSAFYDAQTDGMGIFTVNAAGNITLERSLDYEYGDHVYKVNVTGVTKSQSCHGVLVFHILNVNDNPPAFVYTECTSFLRPDCPIAHYVTGINASFTGVLNDLSFGPILAVDNDGDRIEYSIIGGSPRKYSNIFIIDSRTGCVTVRESVNDPRLSFQNLVVRARSFSSLPYDLKTRTENVTYTFVLVWINKRPLPFPYLFSKDASLNGERSLPAPFCVLMLLLWVSVVCLI